MGSIINVTDENFEELVLKNDTPVLVDFWANWCRPCLQVGSRLEEIAEESGKEVVIAKFNVDENTLIPSDYGIRSIPYLLMIKGGEIVDSLVGNKSKNDIQYFIAENLI